MSVRIAAQARALSCALSQNHWLETVELGYNAIRDEGALELAKAVCCETLSSKPSTPKPLNPQPSTPKPYTLTPSTLTP